MIFFGGSTNLPLSFEQFIRHKQSPTTPAFPVRTLKCLADRLPTYTLSDTAHQFINVTGDWLSGGTALRDDFEYERWRRNRIKELKSSQASSVREYKEQMEELDVLEGHTTWKTTLESIEPEYNPEAISAQIRRMKTAISCGQVDYMLQVLRNSLSRDLGGMGNLRLHKHSWSGTKELIEDYIDTAVQMIDELLNVTKHDSLPLEELNHCLNEIHDTLAYFGRSALTLSGGALHGMKHIGVVKALWEEKLLPKIISGASAGGIVAAVVGSSTDEEMATVLQKFTGPSPYLEVFYGDGPEQHGWYLERFLNLIRTGAVYDIRNLEEMMKKWLKDITFREAYHKTGRILNICVSSTDGSEARLLNYITAPDVFLWSAVTASCSVPLIFRPATIYEKDPVSKKELVWMEDSQQLFVDGSLDHDIPMRKLSEMFNVNFFVVSQVNPHVRMFLPAEEEFNGVQPTTGRPFRGPLRVLMDLAHEEVIHVAAIMKQLGMPRILWRGASVLNQQYTGDINIFPQMDVSEFRTMLMNPTIDYMGKATLTGEQATWPKLCRIKNAVTIELALEKATRDLRERINFGAEASAAREVAAALRGRQRRARRRQPSVSRRLSLSGEQNDFMAMSRANGPPSPSPMEDLKRNSSAGSLYERLGFEPLMSYPSKEDKTAEAIKQLALPGCAVGCEVIDSAVSHTPPWSPNVVAAFSTG